MSIKRKYPVGIQSFESIRKDGYLYVDKTPLVYKMITPDEPDSFLRMDKLIRTAHQTTGKRVVVLVDEYDKMMLHSIGDPEREETVRTHFKELFSPLKSLDDHLQFVFITGIKYRLDGRPVTKVGIAFSSAERNITEWKSITQ